MNTKHYLSFFIPWCVGTGLSTSRAACWVWQLMSGVLVNRSLPYVNTHPFWQFYTCVLWNMLISPPWGSLYDQDHLKGPSIWTLGPQWVLLFGQIMNSFRRCGFDGRTTSQEVGSGSHRFGPTSSLAPLLLACRGKITFQLPNVATGRHVSLTIMGLPCWNCEPK